MLKIILLSMTIAFSLVASATQDSRNGESSNRNGDDTLKVPGKFLEQGQSIECGSESGCIIMTVKELVDTANAIQQKVLEDHVCGLKSEV